MWVEKLTKLVIRESPKTTKKLSPKISCRTAGSLTWSEHFMGWEKDLVMLH